MCTLVPDGHSLSADTKPEVTRRSTRTRILLNWTAKSPGKSKFPLIREQLLVTGRAGGSNQYYWAGGVF